MPKKNLNKTERYTCTLHSLLHMVEIQRVTLKNGSGKICGYKYVLLVGSYSADPSYNSNNNEQRPS